MKILNNDMYLLLIDKETEIKEGDICIDSTGVIFKHENHFPISIGQRKITAYHPLTKEAKELDLPKLPPFEEVGVEKLADKWFLINNYNKEDLIHSHTIPNCITNKNLFIEGYKTAQPKQFTLEDMKKAIEMAREDYYIRGYQVLLYSTADEIIQSLSTQQLPKEFILGEGNTIEEQIKNGYYE